jgi:hypothetical protein
MKYDIEYTDTFGGEANYCWVNRATLKVSDAVSDLAIVRRAKAAVGLNGVRGRMHNYGDSWSFYPHHSATVLFITPRY